MLNIGVLHVVLCICFLLKLNVGNKDKKLVDETWTLM